MLYAFAVIAGLLNSVAAGANSAMGKGLENKIAGGMVVVLVNVLTMACVGLVLGKLAWPGTTRIAAVPWWAWPGGVLGTTFILAQLFAAEQLGSAVFMTLAVTAAVLCSLALDHFGLVGFKEHPVGWGRAAGAVLIIAGLALIARY